MTPHHRVITAAVAVGTLILTACAPSAPRSMSFESTPAPGLQSWAVDALPFDGTGNGTQPRLISEAVPPVDGDTVRDDTLLATAQVASPNGPRAGSGSTESGFTDPGTDRRPTPTMAEINGIIDTDGATLVAHAIDDRLVVYAEPGSDRIVARLDNPTDHGGPLVLQAMTPPTSTQVKFGWIEVLLPVRPNGTTGWIRTADIELSVNPYRIEVDVDDFTLTVFRNNAPYLTTPVGIGRGQTPTPEGSFYLAELLRPSNPDGIYGPFAYGLSGYSEVLDSFAGGEGVIGIHGTNEPWAIGTNVSHGCIRVDNAMIEALATFLPLGTPVHIGP